MGDVHLCFDSQLAGYGAEGTWTSQSKCSQIGRLREVAQLYRQLRKPSVCVYEHVKAHSGQPANELADALTRACQICADAARSPFLPNVNWQPLFCRDNNIMAWAWWIVCGLSFDQSAPIFYGEKFSWKYKGKDISKEPIRPIEQEVQQNQTKQEVRISVQAATFNVLSLNRRQPGEESVEVCRPALLRQQLESAGYHMVGLQETRTNCSTTFVAADYVRYVSGCIEDSGLYGCEIWLSRRLPFGSVGADKIWLDHRKVTVLFSDPRMLALRMQLRGCSLLVISGHAPHEGDDAQTKDYWWQRLHGVLSKHSRLGRVIILGDFNARLGRQVGQITGALQDVQTNDNGERLLEFCEEYLLWVPSTFEHLHSGQQHTWVHPKGNKARIDYTSYWTSSSGIVLPGVVVTSTFKSATALLTTLCLALVCSGLKSPSARNESITECTTGRPCIPRKEKRKSEKWSDNFLMWRGRLIHISIGKFWRTSCMKGCKCTSLPENVNHVQISSRTTRGKRWDEERFSSKH